MAEDQLALSARASQAIKQALDAKLDKREKDAPKRHKAVVRRTDKTGVTWVHILGGAEQTPVSEVEVLVKQGDLIDVVIENGRARGMAASGSGSQAVSLGLLSLVMKGFAGGGAGGIGDTEFHEGLTAYENLYAENFAAKNAIIENLVAGNARINNLQADYAYIDEQVGRKATFTDLKATNAKVENLDAEKADIDYLHANYIDANTIDARYTRTDLLNADVAWIENGVIADAAINDAQILSVGANKLTAGTIDASKINVANLNVRNLRVERMNGQPFIGGYTLVRNTMHGYSEKNPKAEGWLEFSGGEFFSSEDETVDPDKAYYVEGDGVGLYDRDYIDSMQDKLNKRIDGTIDTWTGTEVPTLMNYPASDWNTDAQLEEHVGDLYYISNSPEGANGFYYRFAKYWSDTYGTYEYGWILIEDTQITKILGDLDDLQTFQSETSHWVEETDEYKEETRANYTELTTSLGQKLEVSSFNEYKSTANSEFRKLSNLSTKVENMQVGGRNLLRGTLEFSNDGVSTNSMGYMSTSIRSVEDDSAGVYGMKSKHFESGKTTAYVSWYIPDCKNGETYTLSFWGKGTGEPYCFFYGPDGYIRVKSYTLSTSSIEGSTSDGNTHTAGGIKLTEEWQRYWVTWVLADSGGSTSTKYCLIRNDQGSDFRICGAKFERGNVPTDWTPAPEDTEGEITTVRNVANSVKDTADSHEQKISSLESRKTIRAVLYRHNKTEADWEKIEVVGYKGTWTNVHAYKTGAMSNSVIDATTLIIGDYIEIRGVSTDKNTEHTVTGKVTSVPTSANASIPLETVAASSSADLVEYMSTEFEQRDTEIALRATKVEVRDMGGNLLQGTLEPELGSSSAPKFVIGSGGNGTGSIVDVSDSPVPGYTRAFRISNNTAGNRDFIQYISDLTVKAGQKYAFTAYARGIGGNVTAQVRCYNGSGGALFNTDDSRTVIGTNWTPIAIVMEMSAQSNRVDVEFGIAGAGAIEYIAPCVSAGTTAIQMAQIMVQSDEIDLRVQKSGVISSINASPEKIQISADRIEFRGTSVFNSIETTLNNKYDAKGAADALKSSATDLSQRVYYRSTSNSAPAAPTAWVTRSDEVNDTWTRRHLPVSSVNKSYKYIWQYEQIRRIDGTLSTASNVSPDTSHTVIDGGNIMTGTVTADKLVSNSLTVGNLSAQAQTDLLNSNIHVGGTNLLKGSSTGTGWKYTTFDKDTITYTVSTTATSEVYIQGKLIASLVEGEEYTLSCYAKSNGYVKNIDLFVYNNEVKNIKTKAFDITTEYKLYTFTFTAAATENVHVRFDNNGSTSSGTTATLWVRKPKLEKGNKATDWSPAPEDVASDISSANSAASTAQSTANTARSEAAAAAKTATSYITRIDDNGIKVHAVNNVSSNYAKIDANGMEIFKGGNSVAFYGDTARVGKASGGNFYTDGTNLYLRSGTTNRATLSNNGTLTVSGNTGNTVVLGTDSTEYANPGLRVKRSDGVGYDLRPFSVTIAGKTGGAILQPLTDSSTGIQSYSGNNWVAANNNGVFGRDSASSGICRIVQPIGTILIYAGGTIPTGWLECNGQAVSRTAYKDLFAFIGTAYGGGNGSTTFNVPDLRGRAVIGYGQGSGLSSWGLGTKGGQESVILTASQSGLRSHSHGTATDGRSFVTTATDGASITRHTVSSGSGAANMVRSANAFHTGATTASAGDWDAAAAHTNMQPFIALKFIIAYGTTS